jgi:hypothetical protein
MGFFNIFRKRDDSPLTGCWHLVRIEGPAHDPDDVELDFRAGGNLLYSTKNGSTWKTKRLGYHLDGAVIVYSDHIRTGFTIESNGALRLDSVDNCAWYERGPKKAPEPH